jgi:hypothetical protein
MLEPGGDYAKARRLDEALPERGSAAVVGFLFARGVGLSPERAIGLGGIDFLQGNRAAAARQGRAILDFVMAEKPTRYNAWYLKMLESVGSMFLGDKRRAVAAAHDCLELTPQSVDAMHWAIAASSVAPSLAWAGEQDEAMTALESLSTSIPGLMPALIARDPIYAATLGTNPRYTALVAKLEAQMAATKLELDKLP